MKACYTFEMDRAHFNSVRDIEGFPVTVTAESIAEAVEKATALCGDPGLSMQWRHKVLSITELGGMA